MMTGQARRATHREILVVEDELEFANLLRLWIEHHGWQATLVRDGQQAIETFDQSPADLVLLDIGLPGVEGWQVVEQIRSSSSVPILIVTARGQEAERVRGLSLGADDYVTKPLSFPELMARIEAALRRAHPEDDFSGSSIRRGRLVIDPIRHRVQAAGTEIHLTPTEFRLLQYLADHPDRVAGHRELLEAVWGAGYAEETHLLQVTVRNLRAKVAKVIDETVIDTVYGTGYRLVEH